MLPKMTNWSGNYEYSTVNLQQPETLDQIQTFVAQAKKLRVLGSRHSFNGIADSTENLLSLERYKPLPIVDREHNQVTIGGGIHYGDLCPILHREGYALHNLASLPHISVAGACTTATHGSGDHNQNLAAAVSGVGIVTANGDLVEFSRARDGELFEGVVVALGGLGVIVNLTLDLQPAFQVSQYVYENLPVSELEQHFDEIMASAYSVSLFTKWQPDTIEQVWLKVRHGDTPTAEPRSEFFGAKLATSMIHPIREIPPDSCTKQLGDRGPWHERLPHFRIDAKPSAGNELQSEYFVARADAPAAIRAIQSLAPQLAPHLMISEIRSIAADNMWMSTCYHRDSIALHFTWKLDWPSVSKLLPLVEAKLAPFAARPHWGKLFSMPPQQHRALYEKLPQFQALLRQYDRRGNFATPF